MTACNSTRPGSMPDQPLRHNWIERMQRGASCAGPSSSDPEPRQEIQVDIVSPAVRSRMMGGIRGTNTRPELLVRRYLHATGLRFRMHARDLPGRPDIVLRRHRAVVFVHGCFWHRHIGCIRATTPSTRPEFWTAKFTGNVARDAANEQRLRQAGWNVLTIWECEVDSPERLDRLFWEIVLQA